MTNQAFINAETIYEKTTIAGRILVVSSNGGATTIDYEHLDASGVASWVRQVETISDGETKKILYGELGMRVRLTPASTANVRIF